MSTYKLIGVSTMIMGIAFLYSYQRVETVIQGYQLQKNKKVIAELVDQNSKLMYNLSRLESSKNLLSSFEPARIEFARHRPLKKSFSLADNLEANQRGLGREGFFSKFVDMFTLSAEASPRK